MNTILDAPEHGKLAKSDSQSRNFYALMQRISASLRLFRYGPLN